MTLTDAIEEVKRCGLSLFSEDDVWAGQFSDDICTAIATILNAVVKGDLRHDNDR